MRAVAAAAAAVETVSADFIFGRHAEQTPDAWREELTFVLARAPLKVSL